MKRFLATFVATMMFVAAMATTAFAADKTLVLSADKTEVRAGENLKILATLTETTEDVGALQFSITFDNDIFELAEDDMSSISAPPPVISSLEKYVPVEYHNDYQFKEYASYYQFKSKQIGSELRSEGMTVTFAYAGGVSAGCGLTNKILGGAFLKVKEDATAGETTIKLTSTTCTYEGNAHNLITNEIPVTVTGGDDNDDDDRTTPEVVAAKATTPFKTGLKGIKFFVKTDDTNANIVDKTVEKTVEFNSTTLVEGGNVSVGLKVTDIPDGVSLTITAQDWYGSAN